MKLILVIPNLDKKMRMKVDTLNYTIRGVLLMECKNRQQRLVAYLLKSLNKIERNYEIHNKNMLAVIKGLENQRYLLKDTRFKFEVWTNYKNLEYFVKVQKLKTNKVSIIFVKI